METKFEKTSNITFLLVALFQTTPFIVICIFSLSAFNLTNLQIFGVTGLIFTIQLVNSIIHLQNDDKFDELNCKLDEILKNQNNTKITS